MRQNIGIAVDRLSLWMLAGRREGDIEGERVRAHARAAMRCCKERRATATPALPTHTAWLAQARYLVRSDRGAPLQYFSSLLPVGVPCWKQPTGPGTGRVRVHRKPAPVAVCSRSPGGQWGDVLVAVNLAPVACDSGATEQAGTTKNTDPGGKSVGRIVNFGRGPCRWPNPPAPLCSCPSATFGFNLT